MGNKCGDSNHYVDRLGSLISGVPDHPSLSAPLSLDILCTVEISRYYSTFETRSIPMTTPTSPDRSVPTKPWTSGRVLTPAQRERKRYKDRISKRKKQENEKESLKNLQSQVAALRLLLQSQTQYSGLTLPDDGRLSSDSDRLDPGLPPVAMPPDDFIGSCPLPPSNLHHPSLHDEPCTMLASRPSAAPFDSETAGPFRQAPGTWANGSSSTWSTIFPSLQESGSCMVLGFTDEIFRQCSGLSVLDICSDDKLNQDAMIRGVLEGWHFIEDRAYSCPLWKIISRIDERIFIHGGVLTRLTMLSTIFKMLVV